MHPKPVSRISEPSTVTCLSLAHVFLLHVHAALPPKTQEMIHNGRSQQG